MSELLERGGIELLGRHPAASNAVFLVEVTLDDERTRGLYKPVAGERPLWDFPDGALARREVAAHRFVDALGLPWVPRTVWREDAPHGPGSLQAWIEDADVDDVIVTTAVGEGWLPVLEAQLEDGTDVVVAHRDDEELRWVALLDALMNNADRKAGHLLRDSERRLHLVDHGVTFHAEPKLRTVLWGFAGQPLAEEHLRLLQRVPTALEAVAEFLSGPDLEAAAERAAALAATGTFPLPSPHWPAIPWPVY